MRKILLFSEIFPPKHGGSGRWFWEIYSRLPAGSVACLVNMHDGSASTDENFPHPVYRDELASPEWGLRSQVGLRYYLRIWNTLRKLVNKENIGQIHCGRVLPEGMGAMLLKLTHGIPYTCYVHGEDVETALSSRELKFLTRLVMNRAERVVANSQNSERILIEKWGLSREKVVVMTPGVDVKKFCPDTQSVRPNKWQGKRVILTVGRLQKRKGQDMMIRALPSLVENFPDIHYCIVGDGTGKKTLIELADGLKVSHLVEFAGEIGDEEMINHYRHCDLFALPNRRVGQDDEGFGMVLLEAQACGTPVLAGNSGGTRETFDDGETGLLVDCRTPQGIALAVANLLVDRARLESMGKAARAYIEKKFSWEGLVIKAKEHFL